MKAKSKVRFLALAALIAALYAVLTSVAAAVNLAYGPVQFRFSEVLTVLPALTPAAIPGLTLGCFLSNLASPLGIVDWIFGSLATLLAALGSYLFKDVEIKGVPWLVPLPPVLANGIIVGFEVSCLSQSGVFSLSCFSWPAFLSGLLSVGAGELVVCYALGLPLWVALKKIQKSGRLTLE